MIKKLGNFGLIGIVATGIDFVLLYFFTSVLQLNLYLATVLAFSLALVFNYIASMKYVFVAKEGLSASQRSGIFLFTALVGLGINQLFMFLGVDVLHANYLIAKFMATFFSMAFNFVVRQWLLEE